MQCRVCKSKHIKFHRVVSGVPIYQCQSCDIAFVHADTPRKKTSHIYSFKDYQKREDQFRKRYEKTLHLLKKHTTGKKVLEVGAGFGLLSSILSGNGYEVDALEPVVTPHYLKKAPVYIIHKPFDSFAKKTTKKYDAIILYDVFEHVDDPKATVALFSKLLAKNGIVFIQTPNYLSLMAKMVKDWSWWMIEDHRFFYSKKSFELLFSKRSWKKLVYNTYEEWPDFKKNLDGNFGTDKMEKYIFFGWWIPSYFLLRRVMWSLGRGGLITIIYQKN